MESAGCGIARGVVGVGADQFIRLEINNLTIKMLLRSIFGKLTDGVPLGPFGNAGYPGKNIMSFSAAERTLPDGQHLPVGVYSESPWSLYRVLQIAQVRILVPLTPTMIRRLLP